MELLDHLPRFLDELAEELDPKTEEVGKMVTQVSGTAAQHGSQRHRLGFDLDAVAREYGILQKSILEEADREGASVTLREHRILIDAVTTGMADAVIQYVRQRDAELRRQANEHFAFVAHELRNPLSSAQMAFNLLKTKGLLPAHAMIDIVGRGLARMKDLIEGALSLSIIAEGVALRPERFRLRDLVGEAVNEAEIAAKDKEVSIRIEPTGDVDVELDRRLLYSAVTNLLNNGVKFSSPGREVRIGYRASDDGSTVAIEVADGCGGLPPGAAEKMFAPFVQVGTDRSGYGLGLAITTQAVRTQGGSIHVHDRPGEGCTIGIELPRRLRTE